MYYSINKGFKIGIYNSWDERKIHVLGFKGAKYKKFKNKEDAEYYLIYGKENIIKKNIIIKKKYNIMNKNNYKLGDIKNIKVYTDGSCHNNGCKNANAGIGIYFGENDKRNVSKKIIGKQTNNTAELKAILEVSKILHNEINNGDIIEICSDSDYAMKCCTTYGKKQELLDWKQNIPNKELVREIYNIYSKYSNVLFKHVKAHTSKMDIDSIGNRNADRLANESLL